MSITRRKLLGSAAAAAALARAAQAQKSGSAPASGAPVAISSANGLRAVERAVQLLQEGRDPLEAAVAGPDQQITQQLQSHQGHRCVW